MCLSYPEEIRTKAIGIRLKAGIKKAKTPPAKANGVSATYQKNQGTTNLQKEIRSPARLL